MTNTYPLTRVDNVIRLYDVSQKSTPGGTVIGGVAVCNPDKKDSSTRRLTLTNSVNLGSSPRGWKQRLERGQGATSALSGTMSLVHGGVGAYSYYCQPGANPNYGDCYRGSMYGSIGPWTAGSFIGVSGAVSSLADNQARTKLLKAYLDARSTFRGGNFIAEVVDTYRMLRHPVDSLWKETNKFIGRVGKLRKVQRRTKRAYSKRLSDAWLAYTYGVKPLLGDIKSANDALTALGSSGAYDGLPIRGKGTEESASFGSINGMGFNGLPSWVQYQSMDLQRNEVRYRVMLAARPASFATIAENFGVTLEDIIPAVWEAIPWSFIVDYFVNVNVILDSWKLANADVIWGVRGVHNRSSRSYRSWVKSDLPSGIVVSNRIGPWSFVRLYKERTAVSTMPYPSFQIKLPSIGQSLNIGALINSIAGSRPR